MMHDSHLMYLEAQRIQRERMAQSEKQRLTRGLQPGPGPARSATVVTLRWIADRVDSAPRSAPQPLRHPGA